MNEITNIKLKYAIEALSIVASSLSYATKIYDVSKEPEHWDRVVLFQNQFISRIADLSQCFFECFKDCGIDDAIICERASEIANIIADHEREMAFDNLLK